MAVDRTTAAMRSVSALPRPVLVVDDTVTVSLQTHRLASICLGDLEGFCAKLRELGATDYQAIELELGDTKGLSARVGYQVFLPE